MTTDDIATTGEIARLARGTLLPSFPGASAPRWVLDELEAGLGGVTLFALTGNVPSPESLAALASRHFTLPELATIFFGWVAFWAVLSLAQPQHQFWHDVLAGTRLVDAADAGSQRASETIGA